MFPLYHDVFLWKFLDLSSNPMNKKNLREFELYFQITFRLGIPWYLLYKLFLILKLLLKVHRSMEFLHCTVMLSWGCHFFPKFIRCRIIWCSSYSFCSDNICQCAVSNALSNWDPWSIVIDNGVPKWLIHSLKSVFISIFILIFIYRCILLFIISLLIIIVYYLYHIVL